MKIKKLNLEDFAANELSKNQKKSILGKGDPTAQTQTTTEDVVTLSFTTTPNIPPGSGPGNGDARMV